MREQLLLKAKAQPTRSLEGPLLQHFTGPKEGQEDEASNKPEGLESVCSYATLQNGRYKQPQKPLETRGPGTDF